METVIYIGHSGDKVAADSSRITSLEALRAFVEDVAGIAPNKQVFLTARGKQVRGATLLTEAEIYAFDSSLLAPPSDKQPKRQLDLTPFASPYEPGEPPDSITNQTDLDSWHQLCSARARWALSLRDACATLATQAQKYVEEQRVIEKSLGVAVMSLTSHMRGAEQKHKAAEEWSEELLSGQEGAIDNWEPDLSRLARIPGRIEFARFVQVGRSPAADRKNGNTLQNFVDVQEVRRAGERARDIMTSFARRVVDLRSNLTATAKAGDELLSAVEQMRQSGVSTPSNTGYDAAEEPAKLLEEIDVITNKIHNDLEHVSTLPRNSQGVSRASKMALLHTRNYLPNLAEFCVEINDLHRRVVEARNAAAEHSMSHMQTLAGVESKLSQIYTDIKNLDVSAEDQHAFNMLNILSRLPYVYGSLLIEAVRRREWAVKMKKDSATLAEELATYQDEETRRRKKWLLSIDDVINPDLVATNPIGVEINLQSDEQDWPTVSRQELHDYLNVLSTIDLPEEVVQDLSNAVKDLDRPTKKQVRLAKNAFKNGSVHEAAFGTTSLMLRGGEEGKILRDINTKLEDELRGQKSRVRKLEDLLHRQAHIQRAVSGGVSDGAAAFSPNMDLMSQQDARTPPLGVGGFSPKASEDNFRQPSVGSFGTGSRRTSTTLTTEMEEKRLARRVVALELELARIQEHVSTVEKEKTVLEQEKNKLEQEKHTFEQERRQSVEEEGVKQAQFEEAVSTKKDIMENMEAQQREFANERRVLEEELRNARGRVEEIEDEIERVMGSREQVDSRAKELEHELDSVRMQAKEDEQTRGQAIQDLKKQVLDFQEQVQQQEVQLREAQRISQEAKTASEEQRMVNTESTGPLTLAYKYLSPSSQPPEKFSDLATVLEELASQSANHAKELLEKTRILQSDKESLYSQQLAQCKELGAVSAARAVLDAEVIRLRDEMASEKAHAASLASCLDDERSQLRELRSKIATGETGADVLRRRVEEEEGRIVALTEKLAEAESHSKSLDLELTRVREGAEKAKTEATELQERLEVRGERAKEISHRLWAQNTRLLRLLDQLGFVVSHTDNGNMLIERASKVNASASTTLDTSMMQQSVLSSPPPMSSRKPSLMNTGEAADPSALSFLHWTDSLSASEETSAFKQFLEVVTAFDPTVFADALSKRLRDFEYTARKHAKSSRQHQLTSSQYKRDASAKLAVRDFKEGDLALFLPTRGELGNKGAWAAFNIGAPHHFLREKEGMGLGGREWLVARISRIEERVVDLKNSGGGVKGSGESFKSIGSTSVDAASLDSRTQGVRDDDNPFELSDGLTWYLVHASEDKSGAPSTPGLGKATVSATSVDARGSMRLGKQKEGTTSVGDAVKTLGNVRSADSRRSSEASRKGVPFLGAGTSAESRRVNSDSSVRGVAVSSPSSPGIASPAQMEADKEREREREDQKDREQQSQPCPMTSLSNLRFRPEQRSGAPSSSSQPQQRAASPSKSIRSLARHLDPSAVPSSSSSSQQPQRAGQQAAPARLTETSLSPPKRKTSASVSGGSPTRSHIGNDSPQKLSSAGSGSGSTSSMAVATGSPRKLSGRRGSAVDGDGERPKSGGGSGNERPGSSGGGSGGERSAGFGSGGSGGAVGRPTGGRKGSSLWNLFSVGGEYEL